VEPGTVEPKSGCFWCSLLPWSADFPDCLGGGEYHRTADKILAKEPDGHTVVSRCVSEEWTECDVLFVGEAPGADEDRKATPFVGRSGTLLRNSIESFMDGEWRVGITNLVRCRPPRNRNPNKTEIKSCSPELIREIAARKPRLIVALGNGSLEFLAGQTGITSFTGKLLDCVRPEFPDLRVLGCLHPAYILRFDHELDRFAEALRTADAFLKGEHEELLGLGEYFTLTELDDVLALLQAFRENGRPVYFDTETGALDWWQDQFPPLACFSFSDEEGYGFTVPFDHPDSPWRIGGEKEHERPALIAALAEFFADPEIDKRAQNSKFDAKHIRAALKVEVLNVRDTMTTHLTLDEKRGTHGLKTLAYAYTGMGGYEKPLEDWIAAHADCDPDRGGSYSNIPGELIFRYAGMDADCTCRVDRAMRESPEFTEKCELLADSFLPALSDVLADMEFQGAKVDQEVAADLEEHFQGEQDAAATAIQELPTVRKFIKAREAAGKGDSFNPGSTPQLQVVLFDRGYYGEQPVHLTKGGLDRLGLRYKRWKTAHTKKRKGKPPEFMDVVRDAVEKAEWQHFSTDAEVLQELDRRGNELASTILEYRAAQTLLGTFVRPLSERLDPFGLLHGEFLLHGTVTGRLASANPNLQNIPNKDGGRVKRAYVSRFGDEGLILQADYSQIELRVAASVFKEPSMIRAYKAGADVHTQTAIDVSGLGKEGYEALDPKDQKAWRTRSKRVNFGILYGGGPPALVNTLKKDGVFLTVEEAQKLIERYFKVRPALRTGIAKLERHVKRVGFLETFTGRRRRVPEVRSVDDQIVSRALRQAINFPIQSTASDMTLMSLVLIWREMRKRGLRSKIILTVHDSIIFDCHVDEFIEVATLARGIMENLPQLSDEVLPGLDWSWLQVPIIADCEVGSTWGTLVGLDLDHLDIDELWERMAEAA